jgi:hypothetical protein
MGSDSRRGHCAGLRGPGEVSLGGVIAIIVIPNLSNIQDMTSLIGLKSYLNSARMTKRRLELYMQALEERIKELENEA